MRKLAWWMLALSCLLPSCGTLQTADDVLVWVRDKQQLTDQKLEEYGGKIEAFKAEQGAKILRYEGLLGTFDKDGDGDVDLREAKDVLVTAAEVAATDSAKRDEIIGKWPDLIAAVFASILAYGGAKKAAQKGIEVLHKTGREMVGPSPPAPPAG